MTLHSFHGRTSTEKDNLPYFVQLQSSFRAPVALSAVTETNFRVEELVVFPLVVFATLFALLNFSERENGFFTSSTVVVLRCTSDINR